MRKKQQKGGNHGVKKLKLETKNCQSGSTNNQNFLNPLTMEDILCSVFPHCDVQSLKFARQICTVWHSEATKQLVKQGFCLKIPSGFHQSPLEDKKMNENTIKSFLQSKNVTIQHILLRDEEDITTFRSLGILKEGGGENQVKGVKLNFSTGAKFETLMMEELPNLTHVTDYRKGRVRFPPSALATFMSLDRPIIIASLGFLPFKYAVKGYLAEYEIFSQSLLKVKSLTIGVPNGFSRALSQTAFNRLNQVLLQLLENSKDSLQEIIFDAPIQNLLLCSNLELVFPVLPKVTKICMKVFNSHDEEYLAYFPPGFKFTEHLPNLERVELFRGAGLNSQVDLWSQLFEAAGIAQKVKSVVVNSAIDFTCNKNLKKTFPQAEFKLAFKLPFSIGI